MAEAPPPSGDLAAVLREALAQPTGSDPQLALALRQLDLERERRMEDQKSRRELYAILAPIFGTIVAKLLEPKPGMDAELLKLVVAQGSGSDKSQRMVDQLLESVRKAGDFQVQTMTAAMQRAAELKDSMVEKVFEAQLARLEGAGDGGGKGEGVPWGQLLEVAKGILAPDPVPVPVDQVDDDELDDEEDEEAPRLPAPAAQANPPAAAGARPSPVRMALRAIRTWQAGQVPEADRASFLERLVQVVALDAPLRAAIQSGDEAGVVTCCAPALDEDEELGAWIASDGVLAWVRQFAAQVLRPALEQLPARPARPPARRPSQAEPPARARAPRPAIAAARRRPVLAGDDLV